MFIRKLKNPPTGSIAGSASGDENAKTYRYVRFIILSLTELGLLPTDGPDEINSK